MLLAEVQRTVERYHMISSGDRVLVAVSGGADSMALLHALVALRNTVRCELLVAHLDHALRPSSSEDARFVADIAAGLGLDFVSQREDVARLAALAHRGLEETARDARHAFLTRVADARCATKIALGHTVDDQAETVLFRLARGTGLDGLAGMEPIHGRWIRPLLSVRRDEARRFLAERSLPWRDDETNADVRFARNRIRERVLPELSAVNAQAVRAVARSAELAREARSLARYVVGRVWAEVCRAEREGVVIIARQELVELPPAVQSVLVREAMRRARGDLDGVGRPHVAAARRVAVRADGELHLPRLRVRASAEEMEFVVHPEEAAAAAWTVPLALGTTKLDDAGVVLTLWLGERSEAEVAPGDEVADADRVRFPLVARRRRPGDRFRPLGMRQDVRLKSFLINAGVPAARRNRLVLVCDQEKVVWVAGVRLSDVVRLQDSTRRVLVLRAEEARP